MYEYRYLLLDFFKLDSILGELGDYCLIVKLKGILKVFKIWSVFFMFKYVFML